MKKILCYGDSNTYGFNPIDFSMFDENTRWTALLKKNLINDYEVIEEGMCDRTGFVNNPKGFLYSAQRHFPKFISKTKNIDILILEIGTNDLQTQYDISFSLIEKGLENLIEAAQDKAKEIILIPPVILSETIFNGYFKNQFDEISITKSKKVVKAYKKLAKIYNCKIFDINDFTAPSDIDGLHYDEISHKLIAEKLTEFIKTSICNGEQ